MRLTQFDMELLKYMGNYESIRLETTARYFEVSEKTLRNRLNILQDVLQKYEIRLEFLSHGQVLIRGREQFSRLLKENSLRYEMDFEQKFLLLMALNTECLVVQEIADQLLVSKSYAEKKLSWILRKYKDELYSKRHYGIRYEAPPQQRFARIVQILFPYVVGDDFQAALQQFDRLHLPVLRYFTKEQLDQAAQAVRLIQRMEYFSFTDESVQQLYLYLLLLFRFGHEFRFDDHFQKKFPQKDIKIVEERVKELCKKISVQFPQEEVSYLSCLFMVLRKQKVESYEQVCEKMRPVLEQIFREIGAWLSLELNGDTELCNGLAVHLYTMVMRGNFINTEPDLYSMGDIRRQYPLGFEMAVVTADCIADFYALQINEKDLLYLTLHYQAAIERLKDRRQKLKAIIVCHFGMAGANILRSKMERRLSGVEVLKICSLHEFLQEEQPECDFIVTTERVLHAKQPVFNVTLAFSEHEMQQVETYIQNFQIRRRLAVQLMEAPILHIEKNTSQQNIIREMCGILEAGGSVLPGYTDSVLEREDRSSTELFYIALPHGNPALVKQTRLVMARMDVPVLWMNVKIVCAFLFAASAEVLQDDPMLFSIFYRKLSDPEVEEQIRWLQVSGHLSDEDFRKEVIRMMDCPK